MAKRTLAQQQRRLASLLAAAEYADVCERTLRRMIARGELTGYRLGKRMIRVDLDELDAVMRPIPTTGRDGAVA